jgi:hypothetical protein
VLEEVTVVSRDYLQRALTPAELSNRINQQNNALV